MRLEGKSIVIIGGTTGLGLSAAQAFVAAGASVVINGRNADNVSRAVDGLGEHARGFPGDATVAHTAEGAIQLAVAAFGRLDGLYHVAGGSGRKFGDGPLHSLTDEGLEATLSLNLKSVLLSNRAAVRQFRAQGGGGAILNMGSVLGWSPSPEFFDSHAYAAAKSAIVGFTKSVAAYYAPEDIRANVIAPALVGTPMSARAQTNEAIMNFIQKKQPLDGGRIGAPEDCDGAALLLLSEAGRFITGQVLAVDGGWTVSEGRA